MKFKLPQTVAGLAGVFLVQTAQAETFDCKAGEWFPDKPASTKFLAPLELQKSLPYVVDHDPKTGTYGETGPIWTARIAIELCDKPGEEKIVSLDRFILSDQFHSSLADSMNEKYGKQTLKEAWEAMREQPCTRDENAIVAAGKQAHGETSKYNGSNAICPGAF